MDVGGKFLQVSTERDAGRCVVIVAWGSRGRGFKSRRPDVVKGQLSWPFVLSAVNVSVGH